MSIILRSQLRLDGVDGLVGMKRLLLLGSSGKMGCAIGKVFVKDYEIVGKNSKDFNAENFDEVRELVDSCRPDVVVNAVAFLGIDLAEKNPSKAFCLNTLYPRFLSMLSNEYGFLLVHFSTDAVFDGVKEVKTESTVVNPLNMYGFTKFGGDCFIQSFAEKYYIFRVSILFGETLKDTQFVEKMLLKIKGGDRILRVVDDILLSPTFTLDVANRVKSMMGECYPYGLYHVSNGGEGSLYDLMVEIVNNLGLDVVVKRASFNDFPFVGRKSAYAVIKSDKIKSMRFWKDACKEYCNYIKNKEVV